MWVPYPDNKPTKSGYYMTQYYNPKQQQWLFKAIVFDVETSMWQGPWTWCYDRVPVKTDDGKDAWIIAWKDLDVSQFDDESCADYYTMCGSTCTPQKEANEENIQS